MRAFVVLGFVFPYQAKRLAWERLRNTYFVSSGTQNLNAIDKASDTQTNSNQSKITQQHIK